MASSDRSPTRQSPRKKGDAQASMTPHLAPPCGFPPATSDAESANEDDTTKELNWVIEGVEGFGDDQMRHMNVFYASLKKEIQKKEYTSKLLTKKDYDERVNFILGVRDKTTDAMGIPIALWGRVQSLTHSAMGTIVLWELGFSSPNHSGTQIGDPIALWGSP